jgi:hypothetical protein
MERVLKLVGFNPNVVGWGEGRSIRRSAHLNKLAMGQCKNKLLPPIYTPA